MAITKVTTGGITDATIATADIADDAVTDAKLANSINSAIAANTAKTSTTINNNADNRVITGSGTANTLNGEANLTFDSSLVVTDGNGTVTTGGNYINLKRTGTNVNYINAPLADAELHISADENIVFKTVHTGDFNSTERMRIKNDGDVSINDGNLIFANGHGLNFNATADASGTGVTAGSELFNDYEEGTWTPTFNFSTSTGSISYNVQIGRYTKIGNRVFYTCIIRSTTVTGTTSGLLRIAGLPFAVNSDFPSGGTCFFLTGGNFTSDYGLAVQLNNSEQIEFYIQGQSSGDNYSNLTPSGLNVGALFIKVEGHYQT